jgi:hypothetical protein
MLILKFATKYHTGMLNSWKDKNHPQITDHNEVVRNTGNIQK